MRFIALTFALLLATTASAATAPAKSTGKTEVTWWGHAAWVIKTPAGTTFAIDPWLGNPKAPKDGVKPTALDAILVTHGHFDHVGDTIDLAKKTGASVVGCFELVSQFGLDKDKAIGGNVGGSVKIKDITIHFVEAVHSSGYKADDKSPMTYGGAPVGYVIEIENGPTIYHAGDTGLFKDMELIGDVYKPTVAMLPIGGHFTMDPELAAQAAKMLKAKTIVPMHFGTFPALTGTPDELRTALKKQAPSAKVLEFQPGETKNL